MNVAIAWLLLRDGQRIIDTKQSLNYQNAILLIVAINLTVILLFPPFEYFYAMISALLPSFQGFYFIFTAGPMLTIVMPLLYLEVTFVLFNGAMLWLYIQKGKNAGDFSAGGKACNAGIERKGIAGMAARFLLSMPPKTRGLVIIASSTTNRME